MKERWMYDERKGKDIGKGELVYLDGKLQGAVIAVSPTEVLRFVKTDDGRWLIHDGPSCGCPAGETSIFDGLLPDGRHHAIEVVGGDVSIRKRGQ